MGSSTQMDMAGLDLVVNKLRIGATVPGTVGTELSGSEITVLDGVTAGTVTASKALVVDANKDLATIRHLTIEGNLVTGSTTLSEAELGVLDSASNANSGTGKAVILGTTGALALAGAVTNSSTLATGSNATDRVTVKGIYMNPSVVAVAVPTIANDAAENVDSVAVDVSAAFSIQPAVGDAVIAIPMAALPTDCLLCGAYVTATDTITVTFGSKEAGGGVTGANVNFNFLVVDLT